MARNPEGKIQDKLIERLEEEFKGAIILKNDANYMQGIPDISAFLP